MKTRESLLEEAVQLILQHHKVALQWGTSVGKSKAAITMLNELMKRDNKSFNVLLIVAETAHKNNWKEEIKKWKLQECNIDIQCYASLKKYKDSNWDVVIFDEAHHLKSSLRLGIISTIKSTYTIFLSATLGFNLRCDLAYIYGNIYNSRCSIDDAIKNEILPTPKIYLIPLELDDTKSNYVIEEYKGKKEFATVIKCKLSERNNYIFNSKYPNVKLIMSCTKKEAYNFYTAQFNRLKEQYMNNRKEYIRFKWLQMGSQRKLLLGNTKTKVVSKLLSKLDKDKQRYICFCTSIEQAEQLGDKKYAIHSKNNNSLKILDDFNNQKIDKIFACKMLQEGQNLVNIQAGIIIQLDGQERTFIQRFGRAMRANSPVQYIFYYRNTRDEEYLKDALQGIDKEYIEILNM